MNWDRLVCVTPPTVAPLDLAAAKEHLRVDADDDSADLQQLLDAAVGTIDGPNGIGIALCPQTWRLSLDRFPALIVLDLGPVLSVSSVKYLDGAGVLQTLDPSAYRVDLDQSPAVIAPVRGTCFPPVLCQPGAVKVEFVAGYETVPPLLIAAIKFILRAMYDDPNAEIPPGAQRILDRFAVGTVA